MAKPAPPFLCIRENNLSSPCDYLYFCGSNLKNTIMMKKGITAVIMLLSLAFAHAQTEEELIIELDRLNSENRKQGDV